YFTTLEHISNIMTEVVIVVIAIIVLIVGVIIYGVISTTMGTEEDLNKNFIPDRFERMVGKDPKKKSS
ncbi:MAG: hypothetical protein ACPH4I_05160, partial [Flavobacteriaceae bacterium]